MKNRLIFVFLLVLLLFCSFFLFGCGQSAGGGGGGGSTVTATLSGQVAVSASDLTGLSIASPKITPRFRTLATTGVQGATIALYQVSANGTETFTGRVATTDASGNYTLTGVPALSSGIYKVVAVKSGVSDTIEVSSIAVVNNGNAQTVNIGPEQTIATQMFEGVIKEQFASLVVEQKTMEELKNLVVDDTERLVDDGKLNLPTMRQSQSEKVDLAAGAIAENNGNAEQAFKKLELENLANNAYQSQNLNQAMKMVNELILNGEGESYLMPKETTRVLAEEYLDGTQKTANQVILAADEAVSGQTLNVNAVINNFNNELADMKEKYDGLVAGTTNEVLNDQAYFAFPAGDTNTISSSTGLTVPQQVVLKNFIEKDILNPGQTLDDVIFVDKLGYLRPGTGIVTSEAFFEDVNLYYGSYGGWKLTGSVNVFVPSGSGLTVSTIEAVENSNGYPCFTSDGINRYRIVPGDGPVLTTGTTAHLTVVATLSDASVIVTPVTLEVIDIPAPTLYALSGAVIQNPNETGPGSGKFPYYELFAVTDQKPIFVWSTGEVASITLPAGYSWAYATEIFVYNSSAGPATLEVDTNAGHISLPSQMQATMEYSSLSDLGKLYTNASFISPVDFLEEYAGQKIAYRFYLQRIILNSQGKYNGIAAGLFDYIRYTQ